MKITGNIAQAIAKPFKPVARLATSGYQHTASAAGKAYNSAVANPKVTLPIIGTVLAAMGFATADATNADVINKQDCICEA